MKIITLTLLLCFTITICQSQSFKIGKVDKEEFTTLPLQLEIPKTKSTEKRFLNMMETKDGF